MTTRLRAEDGALVLSLARAASRRLTMVAPDANIPVISSAQTLDR
ncbi:hypothetical protein [Aquamicrobium sp. LC103]|nr:hypothetical protein [Aquamicrobium sp. LC103]